MTMDLADWFRPGYLLEIASELEAMQADLREARAKALNEAAAIVDQARYDEETDLRCVRDRIRIAASTPE